MEMLTLTVILALVIMLYITKRLSIEVTSLLISPALFLAGMLDVPNALSGFSSSATVTIGALFIVSAGLTRTERWNSSLRFSSAIPAGIRCASSSSWP